MRPLPTDQLHGVIHTVTAKKEDLEKVADILGIHDKKDRARMLSSGTVHIVREAQEHELNRNKK
jgi:hypothetical protein